MNRNLVAFLLVVTPYPVACQPDSLPTQHLLQGNHFRAMVNANGLMFYDYERGRLHPETTERLPAKAAGIWTGGSYTKFKINDMMGRLVFALPQDIGQLDKDVSDWTVGSLMRAGFIRYTMQQYAVYAAMVVK